MREASSDALQKCDGGKETQCYSRFPMQIIPPIEDKAKIGKYATENGPANNGENSQN